MKPFGCKGTALDRGPTVGVVSKEGTHCVGMGWCGRQQNVHTSGVPVRVRPAAATGA